MTVIKNSMFPFRSSLHHISNLKDRFDTLQGQMATGQRAATLAEMGTSRYFNLSIRSRLNSIASYQDTITAVNLRLNVMDTTMMRLDAIEADQRSLVSVGGYGSGNINLTTTPDFSLARLDEVLDVLNASIDGRYLFGGGQTDKRPLEDTKAILDGVQGRDGFRTVVGERKLADAGPDGRGRLTVATAADTVTLAEDGTHPFGFKLSTLSTTGTNVALTQPAGAPQTLAVQFGTPLPVAGETVTVGLTLPDGTEETLLLTAGITGTGGFAIGADAGATATNFATALGAALEDLGGTALAAASTFTAADNFFNGQGEPVVRVGGPPFQTATTLVAATAADTVLWYQGETQGIRASDLGRLTVATAAPTTTLSEAMPVASGYGFRISDVSDDLTNGTAVAGGGSPETMTVTFTGVPNPNEAVRFRLNRPDGTSDDIILRAVSGPANQGEFTIGADANETSANFAAALNETITLTAQEAEGSARNTVTAKVEDNAIVKYGVQANENGLVSLVRSLAAMAVETYPAADATSTGRFDGMAVRQQARLSEARNNEPNSIEVITIELDLAQARMGNVSERLIGSHAQLRTMLEEIEGVPKEEVAMEILALQTRLEASYQTTALVAQLSLVNYL